MTCKDSRASSLSWAVGVPADFTQLPVPSSIISRRTWRLPRSQGLFHRQIALTGIHNSAHTICLYLPCPPSCHNPCLPCHFSLWLLRQSECYVVAHRLGHPLGGCTGGWRGLRLRNSSPQVSEERRPELIDIFASFLANLQNQFCLGKE